MTQYKKHIKAGAMLEHGGQMYEHGGAMLERGGFPFLAALIPALSYVIPKIVDKIRGNGITPQQHKKILYNVMHDLNKLHKQHGMGSVGGAMMEKGGQAHEQSKSVPMSALKRVRKIKSEYGKGSVGGKYKTKGQLENISRLKEINKAKNEYKQKYGERPDKHMTYDQILEML